MVFLDDKNNVLDRNGTVRVGFGKRRRHETPGSPKYAQYQEYAEQYPEIQG
jgi:hypothetical protein